MKTNRILAVAAAALFLLSALSYHESVSRAERFERGQKFLPKLNPDEIARVTIQKGQGETVLTRRVDAFEVTSENGYPADNAEVNRFLKDVLELSLEKEIGSGASLDEELGLLPDSDGAITVAFANEAGNEMVRFVVGDSFDEPGGGNYVRRLDTREGEEGTNPVYLSSSRAYLDTEGSDYVKKEILDVDRSEVAVITGGDFRFSKTEEGGSLTLEGLADGQRESAKANQVKGVLSGLRFTKHYLANAPEVQGLEFDSRIDVELSDKSGYVIEVAQRDDKHYLRLMAFHEDEQAEFFRRSGRVQLDLEAASEDEVRETSETLARSDELVAFNELHGSWVYEVTSTIAERIRVARSELMEDS